MLYNTLTGENLYPTEILSQLLILKGLEDYAVIGFSLIEIFDKIQNCNI